MNMNVGRNRTSHPPILPESLLDLVQALGALTSDTQGQREFGESLRKYYFEELPRQFASDKTAQHYLRETLLAVASAARGFSVERTRFKAARAREEKIQSLRDRVLEPRFFFSPFDNERATKAFSILVKVLPPSAVLWAKTGFSAVPPVWMIILVVAWLLFGDLLTTAVIVRLQAWSYRSVGDSQYDVAATWRKSFPRYKALAVDLLVAAERARSRYYPDYPSLLPGVNLDEVPASDLVNFLWEPNAKLGNRKPIEALSRIVDIHFSLDVQDRARYVPPDSGATSGR
jgi:hypothetical protein